MIYYRYSILNKWHFSSHDFIFQSGNNNNTNNHSNSRLANRLPATITSHGMSGVTWMNQIRENMISGRNNNRTRNTDRKNRINNSKNTTNTSGDFVEPIPDAINDNMKHDTDDNYSEISMSSKDSESIEDTPQLSVLARLQLVQNLWRENKDLRAELNLPNTTQIKPDYDRVMKYLPYSSHSLKNISISPFSKQ